MYEADRNLIKGLDSFFSATSNNFLENLSESLIRTLCKYFLYSESTEDVVKQILVVEEEEEEEGTKVPVEQVKSACRNESCKCSVGIFKN